MKLKGGFITIYKYMEKKKFRLLTVSAAALALNGYRSSLRARLAATEGILHTLNRMGRPADRCTVVKKDFSANRKEKLNMKRILSALTVVAAAGAVLGAAGYFVYKKAKEAKEYDELLYTEEMGEDFVIVDDEMEEAVELTEEPETDDFTEVKEAIEEAME